jgi:hypothetical protein
MVAGDDTGSWKCVPDLVRAGRIGLETTRRRPTALVPKSHIAGELSVVIVLTHPSVRPHRTRGSTSLSTGRPDLGPRAGLRFRPASRAAMMNQSGEFGGVSARARARVAMRRRERRLSTSHEWPHADPGRGKLFVVHQSEPQEASHTMASLERHHTDPIT